MNPSGYVYLFTLLIVGFVAYLFFRDTIFPDTDASQDSYVSTIQPGPAGIEIRQPALYPDRGGAVASGPHPPTAQAPRGEEVVYAPPMANDPYSESQESSDHPEHLRHPERAYRPPPMNDHTALAVQSGVAGTQHQRSPLSDHTQSYSTEMVQNGGGNGEYHSMQSDGQMEMMPGVFPNDAFSDQNYTAF